MRLDPRVRILEYSCDGEGNLGLAGALVRCAEKDDSVSRGIEMLVNPFPICNA